MDQIQTSKNDSLVQQGLIVVPMCEINIDNLCSSISSCQHQADLTNHTVEDLLRLFNQLVGKDRKLCKVSMLNGDLCIRSLRGAIEVSVSPDAIFFIGQQNVTQDIVRRVMSVLPHERHLNTILMLEGICKNGAAVGALQTILSGVTTKIWYHFEVFLSSYLIDPTRAVFNASPYFEVSALIC